MTTVKVFDELLGHRMMDVYLSDKKRWWDADEMIFVRDDGAKFMFYHEQDCCESVGIVDIVGELTDLVGYPLTMAEEVGEGSEEVPEEHKEHLYYFEDSHTWTFYKFATVQGYVTVRWLGTSNGYYSEGVDFKRVR